MSEFRMGFEFKFVHKDADGNILYETEFQHNHMTDDGNEEMYEVYFRGDSGPDSPFEIGLNQDSLSQTSSFTDLNEVTGTGYARESIDRDDTSTGFPSLGTNTDGDMEIETATVTFENTGESAWDGAVDGFLISSDTTDGETLVCYRPLSATRTLQGGDTLDVTIRITAEQPA